MGNSEKDNAVLFIDQMCSEGVSFYEACKSLGQFAAMITFLRFFEKWLKERAAAKSEEVVAATDSQQLKPKMPSFVEFDEWCRDNLCATRRDIYDYMARHFGH
jgi:hypothetical protein